MSLLIQLVVYIVKQLGDSLVPRRFVVLHRRATRTRHDTRGRKWPHHEIDKINPRSPRKVTQAIEQHIAPGYEAG
jgi:hypothetical protein